MIHADMSRVIAKVIRDRGYEDRGSFRRRGGKVWANGRDRAVTVPPFVVPSRVVRDARVDDQAVQEAFRASLDDLVRNIERLVAEGATSGAVVFQGGGDLQIPPEILERLAALGFRVLVVDPDQFWEQGLFELQEVLGGRPGLSGHGDDDPREQWCDPGTR